MPAARQYTNVVSSPAYKALEEAWRKEFLKRKSDIKKLRDYYDGDMPDVFKTDGSKVNDNVKVNLVELAIEKGASALMGSDEIGEVDGVQFKIGGDDADDMPDGDMMDNADMPMTGMSGGQMMMPPADPEEWLEEFWKANKKGIWLHDISVNGGICGNVFVKINPQGDGKYPKAINLDPACVGAFWDEQDADRVLWYRIEYPTTRQDIVRQVNEDGTDAGGWRIYNYTREAPSKAQDWIDNKGWTAQLDNNPWKPSTGSGPNAAEIPWQYEWPPIIDWKNLPRPNQYYGKNDIGQAWRLNDMFNAVMSYMMRTLKIFTQPRTIATGVEADKIQATPVEQMWAITDPNAKVFNLEMQSDLSAGRSISADAQRAFWNSAREIDSSMVQDKLGDMTNFDLRVLFRDALGKLTTKRLTYGDGLMRLCQYALELGGFDPCLDVNIVWPDPLPNDPVQQATALEKDVTVGGLSQKTYLERRGYDPDTEELNNQETRAAKVHDQTVVNQGSAANQLETLGRLMQMGGGRQPPQLAAGNGNKPAMPDMAMSG